MVTFLQIHLVQRLFPLLLEFEIYPTAQDTLSLVAQIRQTLMICHHWPHFHRTKVRMVFWWAKMGKWVFSAVVMNMCVELNIGNKKLNRFILYWFYIILYRTSWKENVSALYFSLQCHRWLFNIKIYLLQPWLGLEWASQLTHSLSLT